MIAIARGSSPTLMAARAVRAAVSIGVTVSEPELTTKAVRSSGVSAIACGSRPTRIGLPAACVGNAIGVTVPAWALTTKAVCARRAACAITGRARGVAVKTSLAGWA